MRIMGLHLLDVGVLVLYVAVILWLGLRVARRTSGTEDFYLAGRRLGKFFQFFLNFGCSTDANQAVGVSREIYRQGLGGMWIQYLVLFITLFYRRCRLVTIGDYFTERFRSPFLGGAYAAFTLALAVIGGGASFMVAGKTMQALTPKAESEYTDQEKKSVALFREYRELAERRDQGLPPAEEERWKELRDRRDKGELKAFISHTDERLFYLVYGLIVAAYTVLGGFTAAAMTDAIQGVLILIFSLALIPIGLAEAGGFAGLHEKVPDYMFELFGSAATSEYTWYSILAMILANLVSIIAVAPMMATAGSAKNEMTARLGMLGGMFTKRVIMLAWAMAGLIALALHAGTLEDPDLIWGHLTNTLLGPGAIGLMLVGVLAANMSTLDAQSVSNSALFIRNLYQPLRPKRSESHYLNVGRLVILAVLAGSIAVALYVDNLLVLFKYFISLPAVFGAAIWLGFLWRRLTRAAVILQVIACLLVYALLPNLVPLSDTLAGRESLLARTAPRRVEIRTGALAEDVAAGRARQVGETITRPRVIEPVGIYFEKVVRTDPTRADSPRRGMGRFHAEIWLLSLAGVDFGGCTKADLVATRFAFDALFPFLLLFLLSACTRPVGKGHLDRFFARQATPVQPTPEADRRALAAAEAHPERWEQLKLRPGSNWEIRRPGRVDWLGFGGSWAMVAFICLLLYLLANLGG